jgi:hypothetical protein
MSLLWLPDATRDPHPRSFPWSETTDPKGCLHTTEGSGWPEYRGWTVMPHATVLPHPGKGVDVRQHLPFSQASFALRHTRQQATNGDYVFQFELVGTCDPAGPRGAYFWPGADDQVLLDLYRKVIQPLDEAYLIPFRASYAFLRYPDRAGSNRMTDSEFDGYSGWHGHQHVPQNDHGDPGAFPWARLVTLAGEHPPKPPTPPNPKRAAVLATQRAVHVTADGLWGPGTDAAVTAVRDLRDGKGTAAQVRAAQRACGTAVDGVWGPNSRSAHVRTVKALQAGWRPLVPGLAGDGAWGPKTDSAWGTVRAATNGKKV